MRSYLDRFPPNVFEPTRFVREVTTPSKALLEYMRTFEQSAVGRVMDQMHRDDTMRRALLTQFNLLDQFRSISSLGWAQAEQDRRLRTTFSPLVLEQAQTAARLAESFCLPSALEKFRTPYARIADKFLLLQNADLINRPEYLEAFNRTSALSDVIADSMRVERELREATQIFTLGSVPAFPSLREYRSFLDAAGLYLPRWPRMRLLSTAEKRRRFKARLKEKVESTHIKRAKTLVHRYELTLREIIDSVMAENYGEEWAEDRLPLCGCKDLLGKWRHRGGDILDHADYAHYARIMSHPEHFEAVFEAGFYDPAALKDLLKNAGRLRAASHHAHSFTAEDLRDLRVTWNTIEIGLLALTNDYDFEYIS